MKSNKISALGICFLSTFLYRSFYIIGLFNLIIAIAKSDSLFSIILGSLLGLILLYSYFYLDNHLTQDSIFVKINKSFPKIISDLLNAILIVLVLIISGYTLYQISFFIHYNLLNDISIIPISILFIGTATYLAIKGINTIVRTSGILIFVFIFLVITASLALLSYNNPSNLYPLLTQDFSTICEGSFYQMILSVTPIFLLLVIPKDNIEANNKYHKYMIITYIINAVYFLVNAILILAILGVKLTSVLNYPEIVVLQKVSLLNFIERIEDLLSFKVLFDSFLFLALAIFYSKEGIITLFQTKIKHNISWCFGIIIFILSLYLHIYDIHIIIYLLAFLLIIHFLLMLFIRKKE